MDSGKQNDTFSPNNPFNDVTSGGGGSSSAQQAAYSSPGAGPGYPPASSPTMDNLAHAQARLANLQLNSGAATPPPPSLSASQPYSAAPAYSSAPAGGAQAAGYGAGYGMQVTSGGGQAAGIVSSGSPQMTMAPAGSRPYQPAAITSSSSGGAGYAPGYGPYVPPPAQQASPPPPPPMYGGGAEAAGGPPLTPFRPTQQAASPGAPPQRLQLPAFVGPMLQFVDVDLTNAQWKGSVLVLTNESLLPHAVNPPVGSPGASSSAAGPSSAASAGPNMHIPVIEVWDDNVHGPGTGKPRSFQSVAIYTEPTFKYTFWRADITIPLHVTEEREVKYQINWGADEYAVQSPSAKPTYQFRVAAQSTHWRMCFTSNSQFARSVPENIRYSMRGSGPVISDLATKHRDNPFLVWVGAGGQLDGDNVWDDCAYVLAPFIMPGGNDRVRASVKWTNEMAAAVERWYLLAYLRQWFGVDLHAQSEMQGQQ
ncbi:hypothetical protein FBU59_005184, partial [Linderina macrospora]